jgi:dipeptidyl aminopeptidase/acylaminoacyl peptidase
MAAVEQESVVPPRSALRPPHLTSLDRAVIVVAIALVTLIGATVLLGDRVGVQITQIEPSGAAHSTSPITIKFSEAMNHDSVTAHFHLDPAPSTPGKFSWNGTTLTYQVADALTPGGTYTVTLDAGAQSEDGRTLLADYRYSFTIRQPRIAYLYPADSKPSNIWLVDPADSEHPTQITNSPTGIEDFAVSPDGEQIAFTESNDASDTTSDIKRIDLQSGALEQLTNCQAAVCSAPVWRPDSSMIAYERVENDAQFGNSPPRLWLLDLSTTPATTRPLFQET